MFLTFFYNLLFRPTVFPWIFFFEPLKCKKCKTFVTIILPLWNENLKTFLTRLRKLFKGGKYSREENIRGNTVIFEQKLHYWGHASAKVSRAYWHCRTSADFILLSTAFRLNERYSGYNGDGTGRKRLDLEQKYQAWKILNSKSFELMQLVVV